jgi:xanthine dehydrogenase accessory factor
MTTILLRGGGDLASGVALRLHHAGFHIIITELPQPLAVRRSVSFAEAIYSGQIIVEGTTARRANSAAEAFDLAQKGFIPVLIDPQADILNKGPFIALVDARLTKQTPELGRDAAPLTIGLGPGFTAGENVHAVVETQRGHTLGRVIWSGSASADSGQPEGDPRRVLRAPVAGALENSVEIGEHVTGGQVIAQIGSEKVLAPFKGVLRGLIHSGLIVEKGLKIGDIDPRDNPAYCFMISDKALAVGGGVLEALLSRAELRQQLWED